jgi:hypothetical protein
MMLPRDEWLLLRTLADLQARIESRDEYDLLICGLLLRKLLVDRNWLPSLVNKRYGLPLTFNICPPEPRNETAMFWDYAEGLDPKNRVAVDRDGLLATVVMAAETGTSEKPLKTRISLKRIIKQAAEVDGGAHYEPEINPLDGEKRATQLMKYLFIMRGVGSTHHHLRVLGRIVLRDLEPLRQAVLAAAATRAAAAEAASTSAGATAVKGDNLPL